MDNVHESWEPFIERWRVFIEDMRKKMLESNIRIYPPIEQVYRVFEMGVGDIDIFLLGQDPYHGEGQANGLSFSVNRGIRIPPSLMNMFKELKSEYPERGYNFEHGDLSEWFYREKIFLLNSSLCVYEHKPASFMKEWQPFTDDIIRYVVENNKKCIFLLFGNFSIKKSKYIEDESRIVCCTHPSPLSAHNGFFGSNVFKEVEQKLGREINWQN